VLPVLVSIGLAVALILAVGVVILMIKLRADAASAVREPVNTATNPFLPPVGDDAMGVVPPAGSGGTFTASTPGLYGGTLNKASCDAAKMVEFLRANPDKARAWASVHNIAPADIDAFVATLTSAVLRSDTMVVNHGFTGGEANPLVSLLQAGTAVLVDRFGLPVVKCYCGNPLKPYAGKAASKRTYTGPSWPAFDSTRVTTIVPATSPVPSYTMVDLGSGQTYTRQPGPQPIDTPSTAAPPSTAAASPPATAPPTPPASAPPRTTGKQAEDLLRARVNACANVRYPWPPHAKLEYRAGPNDGDAWRVTITGTHRDGTVQIFVWTVDPAARTVRPVNDDATTAGQYCPGLAG
jgi:hypothetical protein